MLMQECLCNVIDARYYSFLELSAAERVFKLRMIVWKTSRRQWYHDLLSMRMSKFYTDHPYILSYHSQANADTHMEKFDVAQLKLATTQLLACR
jgi:hypothetical protein